MSSKHGVTHTINIEPGAKPCKAKVRPLLANSEKAIKGKEAWDQMARLGVIERVKATDNTDWTSALHLVPKSCGGMRPCSDFRSLNERTQADSYPLPSLKSFSKNLHGAKVFSKVDLQAAFHNIPLDPESVPLTTTCASG